MDDVEKKLQEIDEAVKSNEIVLFMKGNKLMPQCGFSGRVIDILNELNAQYVTLDVLSDDALRSAIKIYSDWPTLPQLYVKGEFVGGCDIICELHARGKLL